MTDAADGRQPSTRTVERALRLLAVVGVDGVRTLSDVARAAELPPSTALRLLRTMERHGFVRREGSGRWRPGFSLVQLAAATLRDQPIYELADPHLVALAEETGESVNLGIRVGDQALYLRHVPSRHFIRGASWTGRAIPLRGTAIGAALGGQVAPEGYAATRRTLEPDVTAVAAPVRVDGNVLGALNVVAPTYRTSDEDVVTFGRALVRHARELALELDPTARSAVEEIAP